jgi:uncharacterized protein Yka (UPF0111/DUF47 family)
MTHAMITAKHQKLFIPRMKFISNLFMPKQLVFFDLLKGLAQAQKEMAKLFQDLTLDFKDFESYSRKAKELEHQTDMKAHHLIDILNKTFVTPIDREDLYLLAHELDEIVDHIENVIHNIELYEVREKIPALEKFGYVIVQASHDLEELMDHFQEQKRTEYLLKLKVRIHEAEDQGDAIFQEAIQKLFREEKDPINLIKWKDILENLEQILDQYQKVSDIIEGVIVKSQ